MTTAPAHINPLPAESDALVTGRPRALLNIALDHLKQAELSAASEDADTDVAIQLAWAEHYNTAAIASAIQGLTVCLANK